MSWRSNVTGLLVLSAAVPACITDSVPPNIYVSSPGPQSGDAAVDAGAPPPSTDAGSNPLRDAETVPELDSGPDTKPDSAINGEAGTNPPPGEAGVDNGPCDLTGYWLITQHGVHQALGVRQTAMSWYYYELEQNGGDLKVKKGLACGGKVIPLDLLGAGVDWEAAWPAILAKNSHAGRLGKVTSSGTSCSVSFDPAFTILGATTPHYANPSNALPTVDQQASGSTPGWEDWDNDGKPGISFYVSGFASGARYSVQRVFNDWTDGTYSPGATAIKLNAVTQQDESVLGATSDIIKTLSVPDTDPSFHFTQFARLGADQVQGDDTALCAKVRELAPTLTPEANQ
jgi:hypothetical protein